MADYDVPPGGVGVHEITLEAGTPVSVEFGDDLPSVEVVSHDGAAPVYFTVDRTPPAVAGTNCFVLPAAVGSATAQPPTAGPTLVRVISAGTPKISVCRDT